MNQLRTFEIPTVMKHGFGALQGLGEEAQSLGMKRPLIVTDPGIVEAGILDRATAALRSSNVDCVVFDRVAPNPSIALVDEGAENYQREKCDGL
ncbi:MAG: iron-containing alcohol dehydrogenase, partial [Planctomycetales bacterium]|nr:iron-containing alcohol dehydrogenase [Planctomycetales bacterium]NIM10093.1 iron-containing alcohol dehydrogenase [Planctomycetales bacterium]NIN09536.1 iron-containing alcohol dehydrogenase [Planctomycetales bacterium]NIN78646.1 iron-containing alcohol dehydrogenase [Planctomycetales bacterium]NIP05714.1 iron-containing alcohol dehydrogenase [Planctomycetales bacterium]